MGEAHAFLGESVNIRRLMRGAAVAGEALNPKVIGKDEEDVRRSCLEQSAWNEEAEEAEENGFHGSYLNAPKTNFQVYSLQSY